MALTKISSVRAAVNGSRQAWTLGDGAGESVEIFRNRRVGGVQEFYTSYT